MKFGIISLGVEIGKLGTEIEGHLKTATALENLYNSNKVIEVIERKGEHYFVVMAEETGKADVKKRGK